METIQTLGNQKTPQELTLENSKSACQDYSTHNNNYSSSAITSSLSSSSEMHHNYDYSSYYAQNPYHQNYYNYDQSQSYYNTLLKGHYSTNNSSQYLQTQHGFSQNNQSQAQPSLNVPEALGSSNDYSSSHSYATAESTTTTTTKYPPLYNDCQQISSPQSLLDQTSSNSSLNSDHSSMCSPDTGIATTTLSTSSNSSLNKSTASGDARAPKQPSKISKPKQKVILPSFKTESNEFASNENRLLSNNVISVELINKSLWEKFNAHQTEMIITKQGRFVFKKNLFQYSSHLRANWKSKQQSRKSKQKKLTQNQKIYRKPKQKKPDYPKKINVFFNKT
jgi:hypothetical protein